MPAIALVVTLSDAPELATAAREALAAEPCLSLGSPFGNRLPVAALGDDADELDGVCERIRQMKGVALLDLIMADYGDEEPGEASVCGASGGGR